MLGRLFLYAALAAAASNALIIPAANKQELSQREIKVGSGEASAWLSSRHVPEVEVMGSLALREVQTGKVSARQDKPGSVIKDGRRLRSGILATTADKKVIMINNGNTDWIFPRGGIDTQYDGYDEADPVPAFRRAASREGFEEAGIKFTAEPLDETNFHYLTRDDKKYEYWYSAPIASLSDSFPERDAGRTITLKEFTLSEAKEQLSSNKKSQTLMKEALDQAGKLGLVA